MINNSKYMWVRADKSRNIYTINPTQYHKLFSSKITNTCKLDKNNDTISIINK